MTITKNAVDAAMNAYLSLVQSMPPVRNRTPEQMQEIDDANREYRNLSREWRNQEAMAFWERHERGAEEVRIQFPWLGERA